MNDTKKLFYLILDLLKNEYCKSEVPIEYFSIKLDKYYDIKDIISNYKRNLDLLDDCIFVNVLDEITTYNVDLKEFDDLLNKEELTESEETYVIYLIGFMNKLIRQHISDKVKELNNLIDKF